MRLKVLLSFCFCFGLVSSANAQTKTIQSLLDGPPVNEKEIGSLAYTERELRFEDRARLLWLNLPGLEDQGVYIPAYRSAEEFYYHHTGEYAHALHWVIPNPGDEARYGPERRKGKASHYGGKGINQNLGDGRAFVEGGIQKKYGGKTFLSAEDGDFVHSYGRGPLSRAMSEGLWSELGKDYPWGTNQTLFFSDRGTYTEWPDRQLEREGLVGREVPTRPAHYMESLSSLNPEHFPVELLTQYKTQTPARLREAIRALPEALPKPPGFKNSMNSDSEKLRAGLFEYIDRMADQFSFEVPNRLFKADVSPSNIELSGKLIDFDQMTAQASYMRLKTRSGTMFGGIEKIKDSMIYPMLDAIAEFGPDKLKNAIPGRAEVVKYFNERYRFHYQKHFVEITGAPRDLINRVSEFKIGKTPVGKSEIELLGNLLDKIAFTGSELFEFTDFMPTQATTYDLPRILIDLASVDPRDTIALERAIEKDLPDAVLRKNLASSYHAVMKRALSFAEKDGISLQAFQRFTYENAKIRNADISDMHRPHLRKENERLTDAYLNNGEDPREIRESMRRRSLKNRRVFESDDPYQLVIMEERNPVTGITASHVFNSRSGDFEVVVKARIHGDHARFFGSEIPLEEIMHAKLVTSLDGWKHPVDAVLKGPYVEFRVKAAQDTAHLKLALHSADGNTWWKSGNQDAEIEFVQRDSIPLHPASLKHPELPELKGVGEGPFSVAPIANCDSLKQALNKVVPRF